MGVLKLEEATTNYNERKYSGEGFWVSAAKGLNQGVNGLQATGWGMSALIADAIGGKRGEAASWVDPSTTPHHAGPTPKCLFPFRSITDIEHRTRDENA